MFARGQDDENETEGETDVEAESTGMFDLGLEVDPNRKFPTEHSRLSQEGMEFSSDL